MYFFRRSLSAAVVAAVCFAQVGVAQACPGCAEAQAGQGPARAGIVQGYQLSILFMMSMPFLIVGSFGGYVYLTVRRARQAAADTAFTMPPAGHPTTSVEGSASDAPPDSAVD